jgi:hypothetical protein
MSSVLMCVVCVDVCEAMHGDSEVPALYEEKDIVKENVHVVWNGKAPAMGARKVEIVGDYIWIGGRRGQIMIIHAITQRVYPLSGVQSSTKEAVTSIRAVGKHAWVGFSVGTIEVWSGEVRVNPPSHID